MSQVNPGSPNYSKLQLAVGTANIEGASVGLNVVSTLRQPDGSSATGVNTPALTGPFALGGPGIAQPGAGSNLADPYTTIYNGGPSLSETLAASPAITGTLQTVAPGTPYCDYAGTLPVHANPNVTFTPCLPGATPNTTTFGQSGGVFATGLAPFNEVASTGQANSYAPYPQPIYGDQSYLPWGGPPAFDPDGDGMGTRDGLFVLDNDSFGDPYFLGVGEGVTAFAVKAKSGTYGLGVTIQTIGNGGSVSSTLISTSAHLNAGIVLPKLTAPTVTPDAAGDGGANVTVTLPAGVTESYLQIVDYGPGGGPTQNPTTNPNCQGAKGTGFAPVYYTLLIRQSGAYQLPPNDGPNTNLTGGKTNLTPSPSLCTAKENTAAGAIGSGDNFTVQQIGFDYPAFEIADSLLLGTVPQTPTLTGPRGQADMTLSPVIESDYAPAGYVHRNLEGVRFQHLHRR